MNLSGHLNGESWKIAPARYAKGVMVATITKDKPDGFKGHGCRLAEALGGRWVHRDHGYQLAPKYAKLFHELMIDGWDAHLRLFSDSVAVFEPPKFIRETEMTLKEVVRHYR